MEIFLNHIEFAENRPLNGYSIGGELYFSVDEGYFPAERWYDCVYLDLKTWLPRLISMASNHTDSCELSFMDGPYVVRLKRLKNGSICAEFLWEHRIMGTEQNVDLHSLLKGALSCCRKYDRFLYDNGALNQFTEEIRILKTLLDT